MDKLFSFFVAPFINSASLITMARYGIAMGLTALAQSHVIAASPTDIQNLTTQALAFLIALYGASKRTPEQLIQSTANLPEVAAVEKTDGTVVR